MDNVRFGIVGIGMIGNMYLNLFRSGKIKDGKLVALCHRRASDLAPYPEYKHFTDSAEMFRSGEIDAVLIATPHLDHVPTGIDALQQGLHVLCEKPLAVHVADCRRMLAAHTNPKQVFGVMFNMRTDPRYIKLRELIASGELGKIQRINWILTKWFRPEIYYKSKPWRATWAGEGGGVLINQLPHDLDLFQWILGMPQKISAVCGLGKYHDIEVEDDVNAYFEMPNGATAQITASTGEAPGTDRREIVGDRGRVLVEADHLDFTRNEIPASEFSRTTKKNFGTPPTWNVKIPTPGETPQHAGVVNAFIGAILRGTPLTATAEESVASVELANAMLYSSFIEKPVTLPLDAAVYEQFLKGLMAKSRWRPS